MKNKNCINTNPVNGDRQCDSCGFSWHLDRPECFLAPLVIKRTPKLKKIIYFNESMVVSFSNASFEGIKIDIGSCPNTVSSQLRDLADLIEINFTES